MNIWAWRSYGAIQVRPRQGLQGPRFSIQGARVLGLSGSRAEGFESLRVLEFQDSRAAAI